MWAFEWLKPGWWGQEALRMAPTGFDVDLGVSLYREGPRSGRQVTAPQAGAIRKAS